MAYESIIAGTQIDGARDYQEDAFLITHLTDADGKPSALVIVADGMGGHAAGNVASNMAVQAFNKSVTTDYPSDDPSLTLNTSVLKANGAITETVKETPALDGMGCTMIGLIIEQNKMWWASVGDSHLYLLRDRKLTKLNADHSYGGFLDRMEAAGTPVDAEPGLSRNMLMSAVTGADIAEIDCPPTPFTLEHDDKLVVCSDGLDTLSEGKIIQYTDWSDTPKECAEALMDAVEDAAMPRQDNTTAVVIKIVDDSVSAAPAEEEDDDDDDITTPGATESTMELPMEDVLGGADDPDTVPDPTPAPEPEPEPTPEPEPAPVAAAAPPVQEAPVQDTYEEPGKSKTGLIIGIAATLVIAVGIGGYFMFAGSSSNQAEPEMAMEDESITDESVASVDDAIEEVSEPEEVAEVSEEAEEVTESAAASEEVVAEAPAPAPAASTAGKKEFQDDLQDGGKAPLMVTIPAGSFQMGSSASSRHADERPRHTVKIPSFAVSKYEVTFAEYDLFAKATDRKPPNSLYLERETAPVFFVTWDDANYYTKWLSEQTGKKYRLLSESEWEYVASTGKKSPFWWGYDEKDGVAHCFTCKSGLDPKKPAKVGFFEPNKFGLHDTAGNVAEWVKDCWHDNYQRAPSNHEVWEGGDCAYRVVRGGSYISPQQSIRSAKRDKLKSDAGYDHVGIRIARELD